MKSVLENMDNCVGCTSCVQICPQKCISVETDREGFYMPVIDEARCVDCGTCTRACPVSGGNLREYANPAYVGGERLPAAYACWSADDQTRLSSTSGGVFSMLAEEILNSSGIVFGAAFDGDFKVCHSFVSEISGLDRLRRSKYVQSDINNSFIAVKKLLSDGKEVLFAGTPCQVAGLKAFLGKEYDNLLTCDFACHGVPSPLIWKMYLEFIKERHKSGIKDISFRDKRSGWLNSSLSIVFADGNRYEDSVSNETYMIGFGKSIFTRKSCFNCNFRHKNSRADITLADFWGFDKFDDKDASYNKGVSLAIPNTAKGSSSLMALGGGKLHIEGRPFETAVKYNPRLAASITEPALREAFFRDVTGGASFGELRRKYMDNSSLAYSVKKAVKSLLGKNIVENLNKLRPH